MLMAQPSNKETVNGTTLTENPPTNRHTDYCITGLLQCVESPVAMRYQAVYKVSVLTGGMFQVLRNGLNSRIL